jgi:hypothetical protein
VHFSAPHHPHIYVHGKRFSEAPCDAKTLKPIVGVSRYPSPIPSRTPKSRNHACQQCGCNLQLPARSRPDLKQVANGTPCISPDPQQNTVGRRPSSTPSPSVQSVDSRMPFGSHPGRLQFTRSHTHHNQLSQKLDHKQGGDSQATQADDLQHTSNQLKAR